MKYLQRLWPDTLGGRIVLVLLLGLMSFHVGSLWLNQLGTEAALGMTRESQIAERLAAAKRAFADIPAAERDRAAHALSSATLDLHWTPLPTVRLVDETSAEIESLRSRLIELVPELDGAGLRIGHAEAALPEGHNMQHMLVGALPLADGSWLNFSAGLFRPTAAEHATLLSTTAMAIGILLAGLLVVRLIGRPLRDLAVAADRIGKPGPAVQMPDHGPREVRHAAQAFNRMQARIDRLIADRTLALAAVSHDLRTPLARLRLRAGFVEDPDAARAIDTDLDEMEAMIDGTLAYLRGDTESEQRRPADVVAILETLCDAATDAGASVSYTGPPQSRLSCLPLTLKRALANLIDNAVKYGGAARVVLDDSGYAVIIRIADDGPGIPEADMEAVFEPYRRIENSRNRGTGGSGLGLTIARRAVEQHGGTLTIANQPEGGLLATMHLPRVTR